MAEVVKLHPEQDKFAEFWRAFPKKTGKPLAKAKFDAITNGGLQTKTFDRDSNTYVQIELSATPDELIEAAKRYRASQIGENYKLKDDGRFTCQPATWLNQGRWLDG